MGQFYILDGSRKKLLKELFHYGIVGLVSNFFGYLVYLLLAHLSASPKLTMTFLYALGALISFWGNSRLTFSYSGSKLSAGYRFAVVQVVGYLIQLSMLFVMVDELGYAHQWVQAAAIFVVAAYLFVALKSFVFNERSAIEGVNE